MSGSALLRALRSEERSVLHRLRSIHEDRLHVQRVRRQYPSLAVFANLRCGAWYVPAQSPDESKLTEEERAELELELEAESEAESDSMTHHNHDEDGTHAESELPEDGQISPATRTAASTKHAGKRFHPSPSYCYFKSTDGHAHHVQFSLTRLNTHVIRTIIQRQRNGEEVESDFRVNDANAAGTGGHPPRCTGALIVDSTRRGKRFPDSFTRTIPVWCTVINRAIARMRAEWKEEGVYDTNVDDKQSWPEVWDEELHMPTWVSPMECSEIESKLSGFVDAFLATAATGTGTGTGSHSNSHSDLEFIARYLNKPLRCMWMNRSSAGWIDGDREFHSLPFTPLLLFQCSQVEAERRGVGQRKGWTYIQGAGDDEENWLGAAGLLGSSSIGIGSGAAIPGSSSSRVGTASMKRGCGGCGLTPELFERYEEELVAIQREEDLIERIKQILAEEAHTKTAVTISNNADDTSINHVDIHYVAPAAVWALISSSLPSYAAVAARCIQTKQSHPSTSAPASSSSSSSPSSPHPESSFSSSSNSSTSTSTSTSTSSSSNSSIAALYLYFDDTAQVKRVKRDKFVQDIARSQGQEEEEEENEGEMKEQQGDRGSNATGSYGFDSISEPLSHFSLSSTSRTPIIPPDWPMDQVLVHPISSQSKCRRSLLDVLAPSISFLSRQRQEGRQTVIVCEDVSYISCIIVAYLLLHPISSTQPTCIDTCQPSPSDTPVVPRVMVEKSRIRSAFNIVQSFLPQHFPSRLLMKQLNEYLFKQR